MSTPTRCHHEATLVDALERRPMSLRSLLGGAEVRGCVVLLTDVTLEAFPAKRIELTGPADLDVAKCDGGFNQVLASRRPG